MTLFLSLGGCAAIVPKGPPPTAAEIDRWFVESRALVANDSGLDLSQVSLLVATDDELIAEMKPTVRKALGRELSDSGLVARMTESIVPSEVGSIVGLYSPERERILLHKGNLEEFATSRKVRNAPTRQALQALMIHELVHAADHQRYASFDDQTGTLKQQHASSAIFEGHAQMQTRRLCIQAGCSEGFEELNQYMFETERVRDPALETLQRHGVNALEFVYTEGERFLAELQKRPNGTQLLKQALRQPPTDSIQIIDPNSFPDREREKRDFALSQTLTRLSSAWSKGHYASLETSMLQGVALSANPQYRAPMIEFFTKQMLASAERKYYQVGSEDLIPFSITVLKMSSPGGGAGSSSLLHGSSVKALRGMKGRFVWLKNWQADEAPMQLTSTRSVGENYWGKSRSAGGMMTNKLVDGIYPVKVLTINSGNFVVHAAGRYDGEDEALMAFCKPLLVELRDTI